MRAATDQEMVRTPKVWPKEFVPSAAQSGKCGRMKNAVNVPACCDNGVSIANVAANDLNT
jgi:hypothetical protein